MRVTRLRPNDAVTAGRHTLVYQASDGHLVLYRDGQPVWATGALAPAGVCVMQGDGNLVCYDATGQPYWHSGTHGYPGATCVLQDDGNLVIYDAHGTPRWASGTAVAAPDPPPPASRWTIYGNFLANGIEPWGFMAPSWYRHNRPRFDRFVRGYRQAGYRHLPFGVWGHYRGETPYEFREDPGAFASLLARCLDEGLVPIVMLVTDELPGRPPLTAAAAIEWADRYLSRLRASRRDLRAVEWCLGWELNQVAGWHERENPRQGHDMIALARVIAEQTGRPPWVHLQPNWWAPHYADGDEDAWWREVGDACVGLLAQIRPDAPIDPEQGDPQAPDGLYLMLRYPRASDGARGICGRLAARGKAFVLFEHSREFPRWWQVAEIAARDDRLAGLC